jgi:large subunit ribosomal protein L7A
MDAIDGPKFAGIRQCKKAVEFGNVRRAFIARDAEMHVVFPFEKLCKDKSIDIIYVDSMDELAKMCGVEVKTSVVVELFDTE